MTGWITIWVKGFEGLAASAGIIPKENLQKLFTNALNKSQRENLKISAPGTRRVQEMALANSIPRTTKVVRSMVSSSAPPEYDGAPQLQHTGEAAPRYRANRASRAALHINELDRK
jgi:hypothetical protein